MKSQYESFQIFAMIGFSLVPASEGGIIGSELNAS
jgi:hypothetical protein